MINTVNIIPGSVYMTAGRDNHTSSRYEYVIGAYEFKPTNLALTGEPFPITLQRETGFKSKAQASKAALAWCAENLPTNF